METAQQAGVETALDFAIFQNHGYKGLYGGLDQKAIHERKGLKKSQKILDYMGSTEIANQTHYEVGQKVRQTIQDLGGTMPESLPSPEKSIQQLQIAAKGKAVPK